MDYYRRVPRGRYKNVGRPSMVFFSGFIRTSRVSYTSRARVPIELELGFYAHADETSRGRSIGVRTSARVRDESRTNTEIGRYGETPDGNRASTYEKLPNHIYIFFYHKSLLHGKGALSLKRALFVHCGIRWHRVVIYTSPVITPKIHKVQKKNSTLSGTTQHNEVLRYLKAFRIYVLV